MKITSRERAEPLVAKKAPSNAKPRPKSAFTLACEAANRNPHTIRRRMEKDPELTLEEALAIPLATREECGRKAAKRQWGGHIASDVAAAKKKGR